MADTTKSVQHNLYRSFVAKNPNSDDPQVTFNDLKVEDDLTVEGDLILTGSLTKATPVIAGSGATVTLTAAQSGSTALFDRAAGIVYTLPAPAVGLEFEFVTTVTVTSNAHKIITNAGTVFLLGSLVNVDVDTSNAVAAWSADGATHRAVSSNGTTTGGLIGSIYRVKCVTATQWTLEGVINGNGTVATPIATS